VGRLLIRDSDSSRITALVHTELRARTTVLQHNFLLLFSPSEKLI